MAQNELRIIAGKWRGRKISFPDALGLRPTGDRIRETLFNWLMNDIHGAVCLDAFSGSGALGFEAASRGAQRVILLDTNAEAVKSLKANQKKLAAEEVTINQQGALEFLKQTKQPVDIIFLDPPFHQGLINKALATIKASQILKDSGLIYVEYESELSPDFSDWSVLKSKETGQVCFALLHL